MQNASGCCLRDIILAMLMRPINLDQASTSFPKAPGVGQAMHAFIEREAVNVSRGAYASAYHLASRVYDCREQLAGFFNFPHVSHVVFTAGLTMAINMITLATLKPGDEVICTAMDHNAVLRACHLASTKGVTWKVAPANRDGSVDIEAIKNLVTNKTRLMVMTMASNVCGTILPWQALARFGAESGIPVVLDSAQYAGLLPFDWQDFPVAAFAFSGHKGLGGPQGVGGVLLSQDFAKTLDPVLVGGTGSFSHMLEMPAAMPDKFEPGTLNLPGIIGLSKALESLDEKAMAARFSQKSQHARRFVEAVRQIEAIRVCGPADNAPYDEKKQVPVVSLVFPGDQGQVADRLEREYGIWTRSGLHCAPLAHKALGTFPEGTVRFSFPEVLDEEAFERIINAVQAMAEVSE